jgi:asparagine synthase (glutamine-hydrolysing)
LQDVNEQKIYMLDITKTLIDAVSTRLASDRGIGFFLSGGLDSSLVVGIAVKILGLQCAKTFSIGMKGSPDLKYARQVATFLETDHTEVIFTEKDIIDALPHVIECLETYDITTVRASIGSFLLAKHIRENTDVRVILNGDGSDEVACGYLYNYYAPSAQAAHLDAERLLEEIHMYDGLRVDRTLSYYGLEARVPFLDTKYVHTYMSIPAELRIPIQDTYDAETGQKVPGCMEKYMLRNAFKQLYPYVLPESILMRRKEAFSNGVSGANHNSKSMIQIIQEWAFNNMLTEEVLYKAIFEETFPNHLHVIPKYWMPRWCDATDPSATVLPIYYEATKEKQKALERQIHEKISCWCSSFIVKCISLLSYVTNLCTCWTYRTKQE